MKTKVGLVTIGQSPRGDVVGEMREILGPGIEIIQKGALDGLSQGEIVKLGPERGIPLITRLKDGMAALVGKKKIIPLLQERIDELEEGGVQTIGLLCTDEFPELSSRGPLLRPFRILFQTVVVTLGAGKLGVLVPLAEQKEDARAKWEKAGPAVCAEILNPYEKAKDVEGAIKNFTDAGVGLIVLDCIGYSTRVKEEIRAALGKPVLLARAALAQALRGFAGKI
jgi:protein AroM